MNNPSVHTEFKSKPWLLVKFHRISPPCQNQTAQKMSNQLSRIILYFHLISLLDETKKYRHNSHFIRNKSKHKSNTDFFAPGSNILSPAEGNWGSQHWIPQRSFWEFHQQQKNLMDTKTPAETTWEVIKYSTQEWAGRERVKEKHHWNKQTQNQNRQIHSLVSSRNSISPSPEPSLKTPGPEERKTKGVTEIPELRSPAGGNTFRTREMTKFSWKSSLEQVWKSNVKPSRPREQAHTFNPLFLVKLWHCHL